MRSWREGLSESARYTRDTRIRLYVLSLPAYRDSRHLMFYASFKNEADTWGLMRVAGASGKTIYLPRTDRKCRRMEPVKIQWDNGFPAGLRRGEYGIWEPKGSEEDPQQLDLVFVPGLLFDHSGYRVGFGGGYYDRFLARLPERVTAVGLCYSEQITGRVARDEHDRPVGFIVTDRGVICADAVRSTSSA